MSDKDEKDTWPIPKYNLGSKKHLHALGVISVGFSSFERAVEALYQHHPRLQKMPDELINLYYFSLNDEKRIQAVRSIFKCFEKDEKVVAAVDNLLSYFQWCREVRSQLLHAEHYPATFGGDPEVLHLSKRMSKQSPELGYMAFTVRTLRDIADKMRVGIVQAATINIHLRVRGVPIEKMHVLLRVYAKDEMPPILQIPKKLKLAVKPLEPLSGGRDD